MEGAKSESAHESVWSYKKPAYKKQGCRLTARVSKGLSNKQPTEALARTAYGRQEGRQGRTATAVATPSEVPRPPTGPLPDHPPTRDRDPHDARQRPAGVGHAQQYGCVPRRQVGVVAVQPRQREAGQPQGDGQQRCVRVLVLGGSGRGGKEDSVRRVRGR